MTTPHRPFRAPVLGVGDVLGAGDSYLVLDMLPPELASVAFERLQKEVQWKTMHHHGGEVPRLVAVEGEVRPDGSYPLYRHPADESPPLQAFSPTVSLIREHVQKVLNHPVNHVLIQFYRSGKDYISEHSDKTVDVVRGSNIVNVSLGAQRTMTLRTKKEGSVAPPTPIAADEAVPVPSNSVNGEAADSMDDTSAGWTVVPTSSKASHTPRSAQRIPLPHNSMFVMGLETNSKWLHGINHDNRPLRIKSKEEKAQGGGRISLTFRHIGTFLSSDGTRIWGQGAKGKTQDKAGIVKHNRKEVERLLWAFGDENRSSNFDWDANYGNGFDIIHIRKKAPE